jgi:hypothetical protein
VGHPFFDARRFPWDRKEAISFHREVSKVFTTFAAINLKYQQCSPDLPSLPQGGQTTEALWQAVLDCVTPARQLERLLDIVENDRLATNLKSFILSIRNAEDPLLVSFIADTHILLDRAKLRDRIGKLASPGTQNRVLLVRGEAGSGKSWTRLLIEQVADIYGDGCLYLYDGQVATVDDVIEQLFAAFGSREIPPRVESEDAYYRKVCVVLQERAPAHQRRWWIVADDIGPGAEGPRLDPQIKRFFDHFALAIANPALGRWFRLVLLGYPEGETPTKWRREVWFEDRTSCRDVDKAAVEDFLKRWEQACGRHLPDPDRTALAGKVIAAADDADAAPGSRMQRINDALQAVIDNDQRFR